MKLPDRIRRWWSPAQWADDHPEERKQHEQPQKGALGAKRRVMYGEEPQATIGGAVRVDKDFKKPR